MKKVSLSRQKKEKAVAELAEKVNKAKLMVFANYQGMTHVQLELLKKSLRLTNAELTVTKNTLLKRSLKKVSKGNTFLAGPTAALFAYGDVVTPLKELAKSIKSLKLPQIKFAILSRGAGSGSAREGWDILSAQEVMKLAALPSREVLIAQFVGGLKSPLYGLHRALNWNIQKLVLTLKAIEIKTDRR